MKLAAAIIAIAWFAYAQTPVELAYACPAADIDSFGLSCSPDEPCAVLLELSFAETSGARIFVTGNLHTETTTLYGILLASDDGGHTWSEPLPRMRASTIEQIQFLDLAHGWISGQAIEPLPRDPFLLITSDGGNTWIKKPIFDDARFGAIAQFWFESPTAGRLVLEHSEKHDVYRTNTGGESWEREESSGQPVTLKGREAAQEFRLRPDGKVFHLERRADPGWQPVASFKIHVADCK